MENIVETRMMVRDPNRLEPEYMIKGYVIGAEGFRDDKMQDRTALIVMADAEGSSGFSITNNAERVATAVLQHPIFSYGAIINPARVIWIEYYPDRGFWGGKPQFKENFALLTFRWDLGASSSKGSRWYASKPVWSHTTRATIEGLIKQPFEISGVKVD